MNYPAEWETDVLLLRRWLAADASPLKPAELIFVFGHRYPQPAEHAARLWHQNLAPQVLVSGYWHERLPAGMHSEAHFFATILEQAGVPTSAIIQEEEASNTLENIQRGLAALPQPVSSCILVGVPWLMRRAAATMARVDPAISTQCSPCTVPEEIIDTTRIARFVGEVDRLVTYAQKGDILTVDIPAEVRAATERLREQLPIDPL